MSDGVLLSEAAARKLKRLIDAQARELSNVKNRLASLGVRRHQGGMIPPARVRFKNTSSETVPARGVMRVVAGGASDRFISIDKPNTSFNRLYLVNGGRDIRAGKMGWATYLTSQSFNFDGGYVLYDTGNTPAYGESWGPQDGTWTIKKYRYGFTIMGGNTGSGATSRTVAVQEPVNEVYGQTNGTCALDGTCTFDLYDGNNSAITSTSVTVTNRFSTTTIATAKKGIATWIGGNWLLSAIKCPLS